MADAGPLLTLGSENEIALRLLADLEGGTYWVFDRGQLWRYGAASPAWEAIRPAFVHRHVTTYDGAPIAAGRDRQGNPKTRPLKVSDKLTKSVANLVCTHRDAAGFFDDRPVGLTFRDSYVSVTDEGELRVEPPHPDHRARFFLPVSFDSEAVPHQFVRMLGQCWRDAPDPLARIRTLREWLGACLLERATSFGKGKGQGRGRCRAQEETKYSPDWHGKRSARFCAVRLLSRTELRVAKRARARPS